MAKSLKSSKTAVSKTGEPSKQTEETLRQSEQWHRAILQAAMDGVWLADTQGRLIEVNAAYCRMSGYSEQELLAMRISDLEAVETSDDIALQIMAQGEMRFETRHRRKDGTVYDVEVSAQYRSVEGGRVVSFLRDITERKLAVTRLAERNQFIESIVNNTPDILYIYDIIDKRNIYSNDGIQKILGYTVEEIREMGDQIIPLLMHPDDFKEYLKKIVPGYTTVRDKEQIIHQYRMKHKNGEWRWLVSNETIYLRQPNGSPKQMFGMTHDITESELAKDALKKSESLLKTQLDHSPDIIMVLDRKFRVVSINKILFTNNTVEGMIGQDAVLVLPEKVQSQVSDRLRECFETGTVQQFEHPVVEGKWALARIVPLSTGSVIDQVMIISTDITERKQAEEALKKSEQKFRETLKYLDEGYYSVTLDGVVLDHNQAFSRVIGFDSDHDLKGQTTPDFWNNPDDRKQYLDLLMAHGFVRNYETHVKKVSGENVFVLLNAHLVKGDNDEPTRIEGTVNDITERKRAEQEKSDLEAQLRQAQKLESVGRLAGGVAHDFNNMIGVILGYAEIALTKVTPSESLHSDLEEIITAAQRSAKVTRQLLAFARKQTVAPKVLDLNETVTDTLKMLTQLIGEDIELSWHPDAALWPIKMDPSQIEQILANLCVNARDAISGVGRISIATGNLTFSPEYCADHIGFVPGEYARLTVSDDGSGMDKETLSHIFEPFYTTKGVGKGTGLGLAMVYGAVQQNNGFIIAESEPGKGTAFTIYLPRHAGESGPAQVEGASVTVKGGQETILLAEDESAVLMLTTRLLDKLGYTVLAANTPDQAMQLAKEYTAKIHLLMTDVIMPGMNGRELWRRLSALRPEMKCVFMSGYPATVIAHHNVLEEGVYFIKKPFTKKELALKVRAAIEGKA